MTQFRPASSQRSQQRSQRFRPRRASIAAGLVTFTWMLLQTVSIPAIAQSTSTEEDELSYSELLEKIDSGDVTRLEVNPSGTANVELRGEEESQDVILFEGQNQELIERARSRDVEIEVEPTADTSAIAWLLTNLLVAFLVISVLMLLLRRSANASGQAMNFGKSRARFQMEAKTGVNFSDV
ncbi:MAG: ATP-dependent metallopeptidase FtsH/Yme1/Tma family protein, partial [Elainellaceae cyanobacterium]